MPLKISRSITTKNDKCWIFDPLKVDLSVLKVVKKHCCIAKVNYIYFTLDSRFIILCTVSFCEKKYRLHHLTLGCIMSLTPLNFSPSFEKTVRTTMPWLTRSLKMSLSTSVPVASLYTTLASGCRQNLSMTEKDKIHLSTPFKPALFLPHKWFHIQ